MKSVSAFISRLTADRRERREARQCARDRSPKLRQEMSVYVPDRAGLYQPRWFGFPPM